MVPLLVHRRVTHSILLGKYPFIHHEERLKPPTFGQITLELLISWLLYVHIYVNKGHLFIYRLQRGLAYLMCRAGETHFNEEGFAGWENKQFGLVQLSPNRQGYKLRQETKIS